MAKSGIFSSLKEIIYNMYDDNMQPRVSFIGSLRNRNLTPERIKLLQDIIYLVLNTDMTNEYVKLYLRDKNITVSGVTDIINEQLNNVGEFIEKKVGNRVFKYSSNEIDSKTVNNRIMYEQKRIERLLGADIITHVAFRNNVNIDSYRITVNKLLGQFIGKADLRENLNIKLNEDTYNQEYQGDFINDYGEILYTYLESTRVKIEQSLNNNEAFIGYFNYLLSGIETSDNKVNSDRKKLIQLLNGDSRAFNEFTIKSNKLASEEEIVKEKKLKRGRPKKDNSIKFIENNNDIVDDNESDLIVEEVENLEYNKTTLEKKVETQEEATEKAVNKFDILKNIGIKDTTAVEKEVDSEGDEEEDFSYAEDEYDDIYGQEELIDNTENSSEESGLLNIIDKIDKEYSNNKDTSEKNEITLDKEDKNMEEDKNNNKPTELNKNHVKWNFDS